MAARQRDLDRCAPCSHWLRAKMPGASEVVVSPFHAPKAGFSNETLIFELGYRREGVAHVEPLVVRLTPEQFQVFPEYDLARQFHVMRCLGATDVPVPRVRWLEEDPGVLGSPFFIMDRIAGEVPSEVPPYHAVGFCQDRRGRRGSGVGGSDALPLHGVDWRSARRFSLEPHDGADAVDSHVDTTSVPSARWVIGLADDDASISWLRANRYVPERVALCWATRACRTSLPGRRVVGVP